jgi:hypothetical protein
MPGEDHEQRLTGLEVACGQLAANDALHTRNHKELAEGLRAAGSVIEQQDKEIATLKAVLNKQGEQIVCIAEAVQAQSAQIEKLNCVVSQHHSFLEKVLERASGQLPAIDSVN